MTFFGLYSGNHDVFAGGLVGNSLPTQLAVTRLNRPMSFLTTLFASAPLALFGGATCASSGAAFCAVTTRAPLRFLGTLTIIFDFPTATPPRSGRPV